VSGEIYISLLGLDATTEEHHDDSGRLLGIKVTVRAPGAPAGDLATLKHLATQARGERGVELLEKKAGKPLEEFTPEETERWIKVVRQALQRRRRG
jgi:hypothetical protein